MNRFAGGRRAVFFIMSASLLPVLTLRALAFQQEAVRPDRVEVQPHELTLEVGERATLEAVVKDADGNAIDAPVLFLSRARRDLRVSSESTGTAVVEVFRPYKGTIFFSDFNSGLWAVRLDAPNRGGRR